jgi:hypothetical protein
MHSQLTSIRHASVSSRHLIDKLLSTAQAAAATVALLVDAPRRAVAEVHVLPARCKADAVAHSVLAQADGWRVLQLLCSTVISARCCMLHSSAVSIVSCAVQCSVVQCARQ